MDKTKNKNTTNMQFKDVSKFNRWVRELDEKDKSLNPLARKSKWVLTIVGLFILFGLSFIWFPMANISSEELKSPVRDNEIMTQIQLDRQSFELPVDSFEQQLKRKIDEGISKKE